MGLGASRRLEVGRLLLQLEPLYPLQGTIGNAVRFLKASRAMVRDISYRGLRSMKSFRIGLYYVVSIAILSEPRTDSV